MDRDVYRRRQHDQTQPAEQRRPHRRHGVCYRVAWAPGPRGGGCLHRHAVNWPTSQAAGTLLHPRSNLPDALGPDATLPFMHSVFPVAAVLALRWKP